MKKTVISAEEVKEQIRDFVLDKSSWKHNLSPLQIFTLQLQDVEVLDSTNLMYQGDDIPIDSGILVT